MCTAPEINYPPYPKLEERMKNFTSPRSIPLPQPSPAEPRPGSSLSRKPIRRGDGAVWERGSTAPVLSWVCHGLPRACPGRLVWGRVGYCKQLSSPQPCPAYALPMPCLCPAYALPMPCPVSTRPPPPPPSPTALYPQHSAPPRHRHVSPPTLTHLADPPTPPFMAGAGDLPIERQVLLDGMWGGGGGGLYEFSLPSYTVAAAGAGEGVMCAV